MSDEATATNVPVEVVARRYWPFRTWWICLPADWSVTRRS